MSRARPLIVGNWKMNLEEWAAVELAGSIADGLSGDVAEAVVCPPFPWLVPVFAVLEGSDLALGAQDCSDQPAGAHTGQVSAAMLNGICRFVIVGHSERRAECGESDELVAAKAVAALNSNLTPIVCVGESATIRDEGNAVPWVQGQLEVVLQAVEPEQILDVVVAYEPIWAIGTGRSATADDAQVMAQAIRNTIAGIAPETANGVRVLYGGSVNAANAGTYLACADVDGLLVGGASLDADSFLSIVSAAG